LAKEKKKATLTTGLAICYFAISFLDIFKPACAIVGEVEVHEGKSNEESANHVANERGDQGPGSN
jgi:hypothetical protein